MSVLATIGRNAAIAAIAAELNGGDIRYFDAVPDLLATNTFANPAFGSPSTGVVAANAITPGTAVKTGTATTASFRNSSAADVVTNISVGVDADTPQISFGSTAGDNDIVSGGTVSTTALTLTMPAGT